MYVMIDVQKFSYFILNAHDQNPEVQERIASSYEMWNAVWVEALKELDGSADLPSDDFTRHQEVGVLFYENEPVGSCFFTRADLTQPMWRRDSYFEAWPEDLLVQVGERYPGHNVLICCYFTLSSTWRRSAPGFSAKRLLAALAVEHFKHSPCAAMVGTMRVNRGMHTLCYDLGAQPLKTEVQQHGVDVDLIVFDQKDLKSRIIPAPMAAEAREIYKRSRSTWTEILAQSNEKNKAA